MEDGPKSWLDPVSRNLLPAHVTLDLICHTKIWMYKRTYKIKGQKLEIPFKMKMFMMYDHLE